MKKVLIAIAAALAAGAAFSQNTFPANGNVTIGGKLNVDSTITVHDTLMSFGQGVFEGNVTFNGNIDATGRNSFSNGEFTDNVSIEEDLDVNGMTNLDGGATITGPLKFESIYGLGDPTNSSILFLNGDREVRTVDIPAFVTSFSTALYSLGCITDTSGNTPSPSWSNGANKIYSLCADIGIGTNDPLYNLDVRGTGYMSSGLRLGTASISSEIINPAYIELETTHTSRPLIRLSHKSGTNPPETRFRVANDGEVYCTSVKVRLAANIPVPDYVFKPDYQLMPLDELQAYIQKHKHLPNIPSEAEIKAEGLNLEEMQLKLLEKTEELTLYILALEKRNQEQDALIKEMQQQISKAQKQ